MKLTVVPSNGRSVYMYSTLGLELLDIGSSKYPQLAVMGGVLSLLLVHVACTYKITSQFIQLHAHNLP